MDAHSWEQSRDLQKMVRAVDPQRYDRKLRLFAVACCWRVSDLLVDADARELLKLVEQLADGEASWDAIRQAESHVPFYPHAEGAVKIAAAVPDRASWRASADSYIRAAHTAEEAVVGRNTEPDSPDVRLRLYHSRGVERETQLRILRDIVGNPFRPVAFDPAWRTSTAVALARQMYESREFSAMPILADALQDAGCEDEAILMHCRDANQPHVRGCWVCDLVLSKE